MYCESPVIILSKKLVKPLSKFGNRLYLCDGKTTRPLNGKLPSPKQVGATHENYKDWCILTPDGECIPIFIEVPCGKCEFCCEKRAQHWSTRATCETQSATYPPVFVTLTYQEHLRPKDGLSKRHVQLFLKRFRINWYRKYKQKLDLRYFAVGEYGRKYGAPHYHLLLWNLPNHREHDMLELKVIQYELERAWSFEVSPEAFEKLPDFLRVDNNRCKFGIVDMSPDKGNSAGYCMKYMRKDINVPSDDLNPFFHLSSRRGGGLGSRYLDIHMSEYRANTRLTSIPVGDSNYSLPRSFKDKLFPTLSQVIPTFVRTNMERFHSLSKYLLKHYQYEHDMCILVSQMLEAIKTRYGIVYDEVVKSSDLYQREKMFPLPKNFRYADVQYLYINALAIYRQLYKYQPNMDNVMYLLTQTAKRCDYMQVLASNMPEFDVVHERYELRYRRRLAQLKELF